MARLRERERARYGARIDSGGDMAAQSEAFLAWAADYDSERLDMRTYARHERWLALLPCPVLRLDGRWSTARQVEAILEELARTPQRAE